MENMALALLPFIGMIGGFLSGLLGLGGGVVMLPLLTLIGNVPFKLATGTDLVHVCIAAATGLVVYFRRDLVDVKAGLVIGISGVAGGFASTWLSVYLSVFSLQFIYLFVVGLAIVLLSVRLKVDNEQYRKGAFNKAAGVVIGLGVGSLAGLLGVGGGFLIIPLMTYFLNIPLRLAIGTSLLIILITSSGAIGAKFQVGQIDLWITLLVVSGSIAGALLGAYVNRRIMPTNLQKILLFVLILIFFSVGYKTFL